MNLRNQQYLLALSLSLVFAELRALVALAKTGSMERAAADLYITPSALTRRIQRLELEFDVVLVDRNFKPPKLTRAGLDVLEKGRAILSSLGDLKVATSGNASPVGPFRLGLSHAIARPDLSEVLVELSRKFPLLQPSIFNDISSRLLTALHLGEVEAAVVVLPAATALAQDLEGVTLSQEPMHFVRARTSDASRSSRSSRFFDGNWVLNPTGCLVREHLKNHIERLGGRLNVAAELHNPDLQAALVAGGAGVGMLRASFLRAHPLRDELTIIQHPKFKISIRIAFLRARYLGAREQVALELQRLFAEHFDGTKGVACRQIKLVSANLCQPRRRVSER
jgi:DNA-binding transcriptional LysR family regulator